MTTHPPPQSSFDNLVSTLRSALTQTERTTEVHPRIVCPRKRKFEEMMAEEEAHGIMSPHISKVRWMAGDDVQ